MSAKEALWIFILEHPEICGDLLRILRIAKDQQRPLRSLMDID